MSTAEELRTSPSLQAGLIVAARYRLVRPLGVGGIGSVWLAHDQSLDSPCALKLIETEKSRDPEVRTRFEREARASAQLRGTNVVDVFDYGVWNDIPFIAMEYLRGEDLSDRLARLGRLDAEQTYRIVAHVARALSRAHAQGIVHRDLKPENIHLIERDGEEIAKVLDFGIAKHEAYSIRDRTTKLGTFLGTPFYMSPEQARGEDIDGRSDLWALAVLAYQCLTGKLPFYSEALGALIGQVCYDPVPIPGRVAPWLPPAFDDWWRQAAERDRNLRFQSAADATDALADALEITERLTVPRLSIRGSRPELTSHSGVVRLPAAPTLLGMGSAPTCPALAPPDPESFRPLPEAPTPTSEPRPAARVLPRLEARRKAVLAAVALSPLSVLAVIAYVEWSSASKPAAAESVEPASLAEPARVESTARVVAPAPASNDDVPVVSAEDLPLFAEAAPARREAPRAAPSPPPESAAPAGPARQAPLRIELEEEELPAPEVAAAGAVEAP